MKLTKKELKRIVVEESTKLNKEIDFGSNATRQEMLKEYEYQEDDLGTAMKDVINALMSIPDPGERRAAAYQFIDELTDKVEKGHLDNPRRP